MTGSHIRGVETAGSKLIVIGRDQIDASGYGRVEDVLATVTQNFNRANGAVQEPGFFNLNHGAEVQLRGLGVGTTLTLVNGQRQGASGWQGSFTDVSTIPVSAIERIEILPEGTAALYGSDAIGGVVNIILRKNFEGIEARVRGSTTDSEATERSAALLAGHAGARGNVLAGFQFNDSAALRCSARAVCAANADFRGFGGTNLRGFASNPGTILDPVTGTPLAAIPHGQDGTQLTAAQLIPGAANYTDNVTDNDILPKQTMRSAFVSASYKVTEQWQLSADGRYSARDFRFTYPVRPNDFLVPSSNAFNHLGGPVLVAYDLSRDFGPVVDSGPTTNSFVSASVKGVLPKGWQINLAGAYTKASTEFVESNFALNYAAIDAALASSDPATALNIFGDGSHTNATALAALRGQNRTSDDLNVFTAASANVIADGPLFNGRAGAIRLAVGGEFRHEHSVGTNIAELPEDRERLIRSGFFELAVPVVAPHEGSTSGRLDLSLAGRYDSYGDVGGTFNPKVGFSWRPSALVKLRGNWGTSFLAPPFFWSNRDQVGDNWIGPVVDPRSPTGQTLAIQLWGPQPDLKPETARAWNAGVDLTPPAIRNFSLSLSYFDIDYRGKIQPPNPDPDLFLTQEARLASLITRNPTRAQIDAVCTKPSISGENCNQAIAVIIDGRFRNIASLKTRGVDTVLDYFLNTARGKVTFSLNGTYTIDQRQQITPTAPVFDLVDTVGNTTSLRLVGKLSWSLKGWTVQSTVNYTGAYRDPGSVPERRVDSWTTVDINVGYRVDGGSGWLANAQFNLGINNALDQRPPFVNQFDLTSGTFGYDPANASLLGRQVSLQVVKRWGQ
ncbi:MAG TPA: TonB-dependent receptor [Steroidobacteraceae bacterium]|nr:TonB-dependent receptor [Steroidobacteraceae bacterium]